MAVIKSDDKLQELGFVACFDNLSNEDKEALLATAKYFITWRTE